MEEKETSMKIGVIGGNGVVGRAVVYGMRKLGHDVRVYDPSLPESKWKDILDTEINFICVPTKSNEDGSCDTSIVESTVDNLCKSKYTGVIAIKSTVTPGTTENLINQYSLNLKIAFVPEFLRERCAEIDFVENHDICIIGSIWNDTYQKIKEAHGRFPKKFIHLTPTEAEFCKYFNNCYNATLVTFANSMYELCKATGTDYSAVKNAIVNRDHITDIYLDCNENFRGYKGPCFDPNTKIYTDQGLKDIKNISIGDKVLTHTGNLRKVTKTYETPFTDDVYKISVQGISESVIVTANHPLLAQKNNRTLYRHGNRFKLSSVKDSRLELIWIPSNELSKGDYVSFPIAKQQGEDEINTEQARLLGYYLSEGSLTINKLVKEPFESFRIQFSFHSKETEYHEDVIKLAKNQFQVDLIKRVEKNKCCLRKTNNSLGQFLLKYGNITSYEKKMPWSLLFNSSNEILENIFKGYFRGDGSRSCNRYTCATVSKELFEQIKYILFRLAIPFTTKISTSHVGKDGTHHKESYYITISSNIYMNKVSKILNDDFKITKSKTKTPIKCTGAHLIYPIKSIEKIFYSGCVYNLEVEEDESYTTYGFIAHNCLPKEMKAMIALSKEIAPHVEFFEKIDTENDKYPKTVWEGMRE